MTCTIYLVRHAIAEDPSPAMDDDDRRLTPQGIRKMTRAAAGLRKIGIAPNHILSSPLARAEETAEILARVLAPDLAFETCPGLAPGHPPTIVVNSLGQYRGASELMLVGHQPGLGELASFLLTGSTGLVPLPFKKGAVAAITVGHLPPRQAGILAWFLTPKQLRTIASG